MSLESNILIAAVIAGAAATGAWKVQDWRYAANEAERVAAQVAKDRSNATLAHQGSAQHEADKVTIETRYETIYKEVERVAKTPAYATACFDADGMRQHADLVRLTGNTREPGHPMPAASAPK